MQVDVPKDWLPLFIWHQQWHHQRQYEFVEATKDHYEVLFVAGNGSGKSHIFYWNLLCYVYGIHPYQFAPPPLVWKVLLIDFEHGYSKIFRETCCQKQYMPQRYEIWDERNDKYLCYYCEEYKAEQYIQKTERDDLIIKTVPETVIDPMLADTMVKDWPSRDNRTIVLNNGSEIFFQTSEQKKKLHSGTNFDGLGCDEEPDYQVYDESKRGLRRARGGGKILHSFTPPFDDESKNKGPSWTKFKIIDPFERGEDPETYVVRAAMKDNPSITDAYIKQFSKGKTEEQLRIQLYGDYPSWGELVHSEFEDRLWNPKTQEGHLLPASLEIPFDDPEVLFEMALDWHSSKPPAIVWTFEYLSGPNKGDVVVWDELSPMAGKGFTISQTARAIQEVEGYRTLRIRRFGDPKMKDKNNALISGFNAWDEFRHCGIRLTEGYNRQPEVGISIVNDFFRGKTKNNQNHPRLFIKENCKTLRYNLKNHYWQHKESGISVPDPQFSDYCVSLRYIMQAKSRKIKKNMVRKGESKWGLTSFGSDPAFGPYGGTYIRRG